MPQKRRMKRHQVTQPSDPSYRLIALTQNQNAIVDVIDYEWLNQFNWFARWDKTTHNFYVMRQKKVDGKQYTEHMAREILGCGPDEEADHRDKNPLNNRRKNLRKCIQPQNVCNRNRQSNNTSGFIGVSWKKKNKKWQASIGYQGTTIYLGLFKTAKEAAYAYDEAAKKFHSEFAVLNFPAT